jgi:hypothetical protein
MGFTIDRLGRHMVLALRLRRAELHFSQRSVTAIFQYA